MNRLGTGCARLSLRLGQRPVLSQTVSATKNIKRFKDRMTGAPYIGRPSLCFST